MPNNFNEIPVEQELKELKEELEQHRKFKKLAAKRIIDTHWYNNNISLLGARTTSFIQSGDYTICTFWDEYRRKYRVGQAKRYVSDDYDSRIGKVAAYARAMGVFINDMIGYED